MEEEKTELGRVEIEQDGRKFIYDFNIINIEQSELAAINLEFKYNQQQNPPDNARKIIDSKAGEWLSICASCLLREEIKGEVKPFSRDLAMSDVEKFVKGLAPAIKYDKLLRDIVNDFFCSIGKEWLISPVLQSKKKVNAIEMLLPILAQSMLANNNNGNS